MFAKVNIPRKNWYHGQGSSNSSLLLSKANFETEEREQCCVGNWCTMLGIPDRMLYSVPDIRPRWSPETEGHTELRDLFLSLSGVDNVDLVMMAPQDIIIRIQAYDNARINMTSVDSNKKVENLLYYVNDVPGIPEANRESIISDLFALLGFTTNFFDEEIPWNV